MVNTDYEVKYNDADPCPVAESLPREVEDKVNLSKVLRMLKLKLLLIRLGKLFDERRSKTRIRML
jgi:hypothetical protein